MSRQVVPSLPVSVYCDGLHAVTHVGAVPDGTTTFDATDWGPVPLLFTAATLNV